MKLLFKNLICLIKEIKLAISLRMFYIKKGYMSDIELLLQKNQLMEDLFKSHYKVKKILKSYRDERNLEWVVWYV